MMQQPDLRSMTQPELAALLTSWGEPAFRAKQLFSWIQEKAAADVADMTNLPLPLRERLARETQLTTLTQADRLVSKLDGTEKYLFALPDGNIVESVLMRYDYGLSACISSQVGCRMGCRFCASTIDGLVRGLTAGEMIEQISRIEQTAGERVSRVVIMGSGEPLDNYDNLLRFLTLVSDPAGKALGHRHITVSTCGLVPQIRQLAREKLQLTLALSLHASSDEVRRQIMPIANRYALADVLEACREYQEMTARRVSYEYSLIRGVNDTPEQIDGLVRLMKGRGGHVNLIPVNPVKERDYASTTRARAAEIQKLLEKNGIHATIRREMGRDIDGACGQLRRRYLAHETTGGEAL